MPDERALEALMRKADASQEPEDFAERRAILDTLQDFKVIYSRSGEFVVTGKYPLGPVAGSKRKVCRTGMLAKARIPVRFRCI